MSQSQPTQKSRFDEIQMLQRQIMFKQLQELQRQQQLQNFGDVRQQSFINQQSMVNKHTSGDPIHDPSQMFMLGGTNMMQHGTSAVGQGFANGLGLSHTQSQGSRSYGTTLANAGNNWNQYSHHQGASHDSASLLGKGDNNQAEKYLFGQALTQGMDDGGQLRNSQQFGGRQEQGGWPGLFPGKTTDVEPSLSVSSLDPLEQKILFNMDDNSWEASFGKAGGGATGDFDNTYENSDHLGDFPSVQSGSWSALMQSAVGEASSSETGLQEEWSGLSFQNPEYSTDNQHSNFVESGKQHANWLDNNLQIASSLNPKPGHLVNNTTANSNFPGFQQIPGTQFHIQPKEYIHSDYSHESTQQSPKKATDWSGYNAQQKHFFDGRESQQSAWPDKSIENDIHQKSRLGYVNVSRNQVEPENYGHIPDNQQLGCMNYAETSFKDGRSESVTDGHPQLYNSPRGMKGQAQMRNAPNSAIDLDKGHTLENHRNFNASEEAPSRSNVGSGVFAFNDRSSGFHAPKTAQTSENMLELLNKVERSKEYKAGTFIGSTDSTLTCEVPLAQNTDASVARSCNQSSASQYFGLRLAPPTQRLGNSNYCGSSHIPMKSENSPTAFRGPQNDRNQLASHFSVTHQSPQATLSGMGNRFPTSSPPNSQETSHLMYTNPYNQQLSNFGDKKVIQPPTAPDTSQQVTFLTKPSNVWINVPNQENPFAVEPHKFPFGDQPGKERSDKQIPAEMFDKGSHGKISVGGYPSEAKFAASSSSAHQQKPDWTWHSGSQASAISVKDLEVFGRSLHQLHSVKNEEMNVPLVSSKSELDTPVHAGSQSLLQDQEAFTSSQDNTQNHFVSSNLASNETHRPQISFPMSQPYVKSYGTLKNGQMLPMYEARIANDAAQQFSAGKPFEGFQMNSSLVQMNFTGASQASTVISTTTTNSVATSHLSSPYLLNSDVTEQNINLRPKKRKFSSFELQPWHKVVTKDSPWLPNISMADLEWAQAVNRLPEKLNDKVGAIEGPLPLARPKKRLVMTTQLMQQLFRPAPAAIFSEDASLHCDTVTFFAARLALGDACNLANHSYVPREGSDLSTGERSASERIDYVRFSKLVEDFISWSKKLEGEFFRLEKGGSIVDMRVEFQELEKFSVINRFAKFHSRVGQTGTTETALSATTPNVVKPSPQRYVTAIPMPKTVPEGLHCLSL